MKLEGMTALVTGAASGLGEATARALLADGANVALFDRSEKVVDLATSLGSHARGYAVDVTDPAGVSDAIARILSQWGALHCAVSCAGIGTAAKIVGRQGPLDLAEFSRTIQVNLVGTFNILRLAADAMMKNEPNEEGERGVIINTASIAAFDGQIGQAAYAASKAGVVGLALPAAREFAPVGIRVMTIAPGIFRTPMLAGLPEAAQKSLGQQVPFPSRLGDPAEYAALVKHIVANVMLNGEVIRLDGALRMAPK
ncbi:MAG: 3-hydroxyacyl-CoA dehydrogenase [Myxococcales bacterium]|nr:3-hydroxyacyl-CoA dehydrogenase [Myxococcales bacterium]